MERRRQLTRWTLFAVTVGFTIVSVFPYYWMVASAFKPRNEILRMPPTWFPQAPTLENFGEVLFNTPFLRYFVNSLRVGVSAALLGLLLASLGSYALARIAFRGRSLLSMFVLFTQMFPLAVLIVPMFILWRRTGLLNTHLALIISYVAITLPPGLWLLRAYYSSIPLEIEDAARVDGCTSFALFWRIILPLAVPGLVSVFLYTVVVCWQEYLFAITLVSDDDLRTLPLVLNTFFGERATNWGGAMAAAVLMSLPVAVVFLGLQRYFLAGLTAGSVKG